MAQRPHQQAQNTDKRHTPFRAAQRGFVKEGIDQDRRGEQDRQRAEALQEGAPFFRYGGQVDAEDDVQQAGEQEVDVVGAVHIADALVGLVQPGETGLHVEAGVEEDGDGEEAEGEVQAVHGVSFGS